MMQDFAGFLTPCFKGGFLFLRAHLLSHLEFQILSLRPILNPT